MEIRVSARITLMPVSRKGDEELIPLVQAYYREDQHEDIPTEYIDKTLSHFSAHPDQGGVFFIQHDHQVVGYCILVNFWSNEYGGNILSLDEIYVIPASRGQRIATDIIGYLISSKFNDAKAHQLVVNKHNEHARSLYEKMGFKQYGGTMMLYEYPESSVEDSLAKLKT